MAAQAISGGDHWEVLESAAVRNDLERTVSVADHGGSGLRDEVGRPDRTESAALSQAGQRQCRSLLRLWGRAHSTA